MLANITKLPSQRAGTCQVVEWGEKGVLVPAAWGVPT